MKEIMIVTGVRVDSPLSKISKINNSNTK